MGRAGVGLRYPLCGYCQAVTASQRWLLRLYVLRSVVAKSVPVQVRSSKVTRGGATVMKL